MLSLNGTILDATAIIDFRWPNEWEFRGDRLAGDNASGRSGLVIGG